MSFLLVFPDKSNVSPFIQSEKEGFGWSRLISAGLKIALTLLTSPSQGLDKSDPGVGGVGGASDFPTQAIMGTVISAVTGSEDPREVAKMAKQAVEVMGLVTSLFEALRHSFLPAR